MLRAHVITPEPFVPTLRKRLASAFTVVSCPDDCFSRGAIFSLIDVQLGLKDKCWPEGMRFKPVNGSHVLTVRGGALVNEGGGMRRI
jgi:hypothetical protein